MTADKELEDFRAAKPGVYENIRHEDYHALDVCSFSRLSKLRRSAAHCWAAMKDKIRSDALRLGDAAHLFTLQPEIVDERYVVVAGKCAGRTKAGDPCSYNGTVEHLREWYCARHAPENPVSSGRERLTLEERDTCIGIRDSVLGNPRCRDLIDGPGPVELAIVWMDPYTGVICKGKIDKLNLDLGAVCDLKTCLDARADQFMRKILLYGYNLQGAMYLDGCKILGIDARHYVPIAAEKKAPFLCKPYRLLDEVIDASRPVTRKLMLKYSQCADQTDWPGYSTQIEDLGLPSWDWKKLLLEGDSDE